MIQPFEVLNVLDYHAELTLNSHGKAFIKARIDTSKEEEYLAATHQQTTWIELTVESEEGEIRSLFAGILERMVIQKEAETSIMELNLITGSVLLEQKKHLRSFQDQSLTYRDIIDACNKGYEDVAVIMTVGRNETLPHLIMQYRESDWDFLKRICALAGGFLIPSHTVRGIKYFFGLPKKNKTTVLDTNNYSIEDDKIRSYVVEEREIHEIGEDAVFKGNSFPIWKMSTEMRGNELYHRYWISKDTNKLIHEQDKYQDKLIGASLFGTVTEVKQEQVKIEIRDDENKKHTGSHWFPFSTVYSSPDGAGWYCMPEEGDKVRLYLPTVCEEDAYVCSAVHDNGGEGVRINPDNKIWRNPQGKEIRLTPDSILVTNNDGNSIELLDNQGIKIKSKGFIRICTQGRMQIESGNSGLELSAAKRVRIQQGDTELCLEDGIQITGGKVNIR